jgi:hypothetical protein
MDLTNNYRIFYSTATQYILFLGPHRTFSNTDHILGHSKSYKYKKTKITSHILSDYSGIKLEVNSKRNYRKSTNI